MPSKTLEEEITDKLILDEAFKILDQTEKEIMVNRYYKSLTQSKTAEILNMTQVQVSRAEKKILLKLKDVLKAGYVDEYYEKVNGYIKQWKDAYRDEISI